ncbi:MAG: hypothetical protein J0L61_12050 [Planctomycetes bacterium]|nr:hypothetical protein [Planctomycetota bacterium]
MNRPLLYLLSPEAVLALMTAVVFGLCARHPSGEGADLRLLERVVMVLPFVVVPIAFATVFVPGARTWWWWGRVQILTLVALAVCAGRLIHGFGMGAKGQDAAFILVISFGLIGTALGSAITGAMVLAETRPGFAGWFRAHPILGSLLTLLSAIPLGAIAAFAVAITLGVVGGLWTAMKR